MMGMVTAGTLSKLGSGTVDDYIVLGILAPLVILMFLIK
jgi:hypothetical protein